MHRAGPPHVAQPCSRRTLPWPRRLTRARSALKRRHDRRRIAHVNVTASPTAEWTAQQVVEAFPWDEAPRFLLRDRDSIYGDAFATRVRGLGIEEIKSAPRSPWQNPYAERVIGTLRRKLTDHVIVRAGGLHHRYERRAA